MRDDNEQASPFDATAPQPEWDSFDDRSVDQEDCGLSNKDASPQNQKKPYRKPSYRFEQVFETMALSCGKISATQFQCRFHRRSS
jgi:hypothetical protein